MSLKKLGRYDLIRVLGKGAMGLVYEGRDPNLDRKVAVKTIKVENLSDAAAADYEVRFRTEARSAARLQHPNIVSVYDSDRDGDTAYLVMEFIQGDDLKHHLDKGQLYTLGQTLGIMTGLLSALDYAHRQGVVHRDIKPANLLIERDGRIKLTDFGVARIQDSGDLTRTQGTIVGTLKYMSPEQVQGRPVDARTDVFAAGVVLYQLLTGRRPFDGGSDFATIQQIVNHTPPAPGLFNDRLPPALDALMARALAKSRDERYSCAADFAQALQDAVGLAGDTSVVPPMLGAACGPNATWTGTVNASDALTGLQPDTGTAAATATVVQELELVYWKDIKDSVDTEDLQLFIDKFPSGIYAGLARRRLKKLNALPGDETGMDVSAVTPGVAADPDRTIPIPRAQTMPAASARSPQRAEAAAGAVAMADGSTIGLLPDARGVSDVTLTAPLPPGETAQPAAGVSAAAAGRASAPMPGGNTADTVTGLFAATAAVRSRPSRAIAWAVAGAALVAVSAMAASWWSAADSVPETAQASGSGLMTVASTVSGTPSAGASAASGGAAAGGGQAAMPSAALAAAAQPLSSASAAEARKAAVEKAAAARAARASAALSRDGAVQDAAAARKSATASAQAGGARAAEGGSAHPEAACEGRILLGFQMCIAQQCAKPAFAAHPVCAKRRAIEQQRRDEEMLRK